MRYLKKLNPKIEIGWIFRNIVCSGLVYSFVIEILELGQVKMACQMVFF